MKATELRAGNLTFFKEKERELNLWDFSTYIQTNIGYYKPIPLTEEWLVKFGYAVRKSLGFEAYEINDIYTVYYNTTATPNGFEMCFGDFEIEIKWVHKLQNLHFALTGEELNQNKEDESK